MATAGQDNHVLAFFTTMEMQGARIVRENPKLDLNSYISNYTGRSLFTRLLHIGQASVPLCVDALKAAIYEAKKGKDVQRYRDAWECITIAAPNEPEAAYDGNWVKTTENHNKRESNRLELELKGYKNNMIKESIRIGHRELGEHLESIGDLAGALDTYTKMRPDASTQHHILDVTKHVIGILLQRRDWPSVLANVSKVIPGNASPENQKNLQPYQMMVTGLAHLGTERYYDAARCFLDAGDPAICKQYRNIASTNDVAIYGGLLALSSMDRDELQTRVLDNSNFRNYLELEPHIRKAISMFVNGRYSACLDILESYRADYLLDIYLCHHVDILFSKIRNKCIIQYFLPFSCVTLQSMNDAFAKPGESLEAELISMIKSGVLKARIDTIDKLLVAVSTNPRVEMQQKALETAKKYEREALERIRRMSLAAAELEVKAVPKKAGSGIPDAWLEDSRRQLTTDDMPMV